MMEILSLIQGSDSWLAARLEHFTASEAAAMMGASPYMTRDELLAYKKTGITKEVDSATQKRFDNGHAVEAMARPIAESLLAVELFPVTGRAEIEGLPLLASFDGLDMLETVIFEHKAFNASKVEKIKQDQRLPPEYYWQLEMQLLVSGAEYVMFVMSDGTEENFFSTRYESQPERRAALIAGWKQFQVDLKNYAPAEYAEVVQGKALMELPALSIQLVGQVTGSNLAVYKETALAFVQSINTNLQTDQDFADAEKTIKFCDGAEKELELVKKQALSQTADIDLLFRTVDELKESMRAKRLELNKLVESRKVVIRNEIVLNAKTALAEHVAKLNYPLGLEFVYLPTIDADFAGAIKGKKTIKSLHEAANDELARAKIAAGQLADKMTANLVVFAELANNHRFLFNDLQQIVLKPADDFSLLVKSRIDAHEKAEQARRDAERERIRLEEERKAQKIIEQAEKARAEEARKAADVARFEAAARMAEENKQITPELKANPILESVVKQSLTPQDDEQSSDESEIVGFLYAQCKIYGEQGKALARLLMANRVPCMRYEARKAKAA